MERAQRAQEDDGASAPARRDVSARTYLELRALASLAALWCTRHALGGPLPAGLDVAAHVVRTDFAVDQLLPHGRLDGWFPGFGSGYRLFAVNGPGLALASGLVRLATFGQVGTGRSFAVVGVVGLAALPWAVAALARELGATRVAAAVHGGLALGASAIYGGGFAGLYATGLLAHTLALPLQVLALALLVRLARGPDPRATAGVALLVGALWLLHPISLVVLAPVTALVVALAVHPTGVRTVAGVLGRLALPAAWGTAVAGAWFVPFVRTRDLRGGISAWATPPLPTRLEDVLRGDVVLARPLVLAGLAALVVTVARSPRSVPQRLRLVPPAVGLVYLVASHWAVGHQVGPQELLVQLPNRGLALVAILFLFPLAGVVGDLVVLAVDAVPADRRPSFDLARPVALAVVAVAAFAAPLLLPVGLDPHQEPPAPSPDLVATAADLHRLVPPGGRHLFVYPTTGVALGTDVPARWLALASGTDAAHLYLAEATREPAAGLLEGQFLRTSTADQGAPLLRRFGVTHVVVADPADALALAGSGQYEGVAQRGPLAVFAVRPAADRPPVPALLQPDDDAASATGSLAADLRHVDPEHLAWTTTADRPLTVVAPVAHDPDWRATVDGEPVAVTRRDRGLVGFELPAGTHRVDLRFTGSRNDPLGLALTVLALATVVAVLAVSRPRGGARPGPPDHRAPAATDRPAEDDRPRADR